MVVAIGDVRMPAVLFVRSLSASLPVQLACRVEWTVSGRIRPGMRCPEGCPIVASMWTPDTTARTSDGDQACGRSGIEHGCRWSCRAGPAAGSGWGWPKGACALPACPVRAAAWIAVAGWPGAWADAGRWRCPPLGRRRPDRVQTHRRGGRLELGVSGRPDGREVRHVRRPASHCRGCPPEELIGGDGVQAVSGGRTLVEAGGQTDCGHVRHAMARSSRCPPGGPELGARVDERLRRGGLLSATDRADGRGWVGQRVSVSGSRPSALAGRAGALLDVGSLPAGLIGLRRANRSAGLAGVEPNIKKPIGHIPLAK
jgi:hypothetical protein